MVGDSWSAINNSGQSNDIKFSGLSIFSKEHYAPILFEQRQHFPQLLTILSPTYANTVVLFLKQLFANIIHITSPEFLFLTGGTHPTHHVPGLGLLHWFEVITIIAGWYWFWKEKQPWQAVVAGWVVLATLPALITFESTHPIRFLPGLVPMAIISSYGLARLVYILATQVRLPQTRFFSLILIVAVIIYSWYYTVATYFIQFPVNAKDTWPWYTQQLVSKTWPIRENYDLVIMQGESSSPYIYFLYYQQLNPQQLSSTMQYYPEDKEGFEHVKQLDNIHFETVAWDKLEGHVDRVLYVLRPSEIPGDKLAKTEYRVIDRITDPNSKVELILLEYARFR
jgi:hypothetical protein